MTGFPTTADLQAFLQNAGVLTGSLPPGVDWIVESARLQWERDTGYRGWLAATETRTYPIRQGLLVPDSGIIRLIAVTSDGTVLDPDEYQLLPLYSSPNHWLRILTRYFGEADVEAVYGWSEEAGEEVPADAWHAVLVRAAITALSSVTLNPVVGELSSIQQGDVRYTYATSGGRTSRTLEWQLQYQSAVNRYQRLRIS